MCFIIPFYLIKNQTILMQDSTNFQRTAAMFLLRTLLGLIFLMQGWGKVFSFGIDGVYKSAFAAMETTWIPVFLLKFTAYFTSYAELIGGLFLVLGLFRKWTYLAFGVVLLLVSYGHGLTSPIWDLQNVFFRAALLVPLMLLPIEWDKWAVDRMIGK